MAEPKKFTEEEMKKVNEIKTKYQEITVSLGQVELDRLLLEEQRTELNRQYKEQREIEAKYAKELSAKYGVGTLDIETGNFIPQE
tara:strand:- start:256 stop:510 length:255 start_codon:yes stop_codon:yes gene_type:complete